MRSTDIKNLTSTRVVGTFQLQMMLMDHTTEDYASVIQRRAGELYDDYRRRTNAPMSSPIFQLGKHDNRLALEIHLASEATPIGVVPLKRVADFLTIDERKPAKPMHPKGHRNAGYGFWDLKTELAQYTPRLNEPAKHQLEQYLGGFGADQTPYTFDIDVTEESLTVIAFRQFQRFSTVTLFY